MENGNVIADKTTRGADLCSDGSYSYDNHVNPFKSLNYVNYTLTNLSSNNRLTEDVNYVGCAFPTLVPESFTYEYDDEGFPTTVTTHYKGESPNSVREFFYR